MHLIVSFAGAASEPARHALSTLELPHLAQLLARLAPTQRLGNDDYSLSTPHELALAAAWGWQGNDGALPFAAHDAAADGIEVSDRAWGLLTPAHWLVGRDHVTMLDPEELALDAAASRALFDAVQPLFESEGFTLAWGAPLRWYAADESLVELPCASLDRVIGRNVDRWLPDTRQAALLRRLQSEVQMLLYPHALNESREASGQITVNSFWLSGCGRRQFGADSSVNTIHDLRRPVLNDDWAAWAEAWQALDAGALRDLLARCERREPIALTLCGERFAQRFEPAERSWAQRLRARWQAPAPNTVLEAL